MVLSAFFTDLAMSVCKKSCPYKYKLNGQLLLRGKFYSIGVTLFLSPERFQM